MAKDLNRSIKIFIDNSDAMKKSQDLELRMKKLRDALAELDAQGKRGTPEYARTEKALAQLSSSYGRYQDQLKETDRILKNLSGATEKELLAVRSQLRQDLKQTIRGTDEYKAKLQALLAVEKELNIVNTEKNSSMGKNSTMWSKMADGFNKYFGIVTSVIAGITGMSFALRKLAEDNAKMDDVYSDVMKTTGMTRDQVLDLNDTFKQMDTRTAREELNNLARDAGKLGLSGKKDILDFVEAGNQINVSLGEDLGEGAIKNIGKMTDVYALSTKELDRLDLKGKMLSIGSAINELGASSTASEAYMVNFSQRLGGVASQAGISIQNILGYASALDQSGQAVEMSATALQKFIMTVMGDPVKFAKLAGIEVKVFNKLLRDDANEAIKLVLTSLADKGGFQALIPIFKDMGLDGARAVGVLSALATNIDKVNTAQDISNKAFADATSITNEYNIKNNNLQAQLEKSRNTFKDAALDLGERLSPALLVSTNYVTYLVKILPSLISFFEKYGKTLLYLTGLYLSYNVALKLQIYWQTISNSLLAISKMRFAEKALVLALQTGNTTRAAAAERLYASSVASSSIATKAYIVVVKSLSVIWYFLTLRFAKAREALQAFTASLNLSPVGLATTAILGLIAVFGYLIYKVNQTITAQKAIEKATKDLNDELAREQSEANKLFEALKRTNPESEEHRKIKDKIISLYGPYLKGLIDEKGNLIDIANAQEIVNTKIWENISLKIKNSATEIIQTDGIKRQIKEVDEVVTMLQKQLGAGFSTEAANVVRENIHKAIDKSIAEGKDGMVDLTKAINDVVKKESSNTSEKFGFFEPKSISFQVASVASAVYNTQREVKKVENQFKGLISDATVINDIIGTDNGTNNDDYTPPAGTPDKKLADKQKKELDLLLEELETTHQKKMFAIKEQYRDGTIKSESEYNSQLFAQEQAYYLLQEKTLSSFLTKVSDKELKSSIQKQISDIRVKQIDEAIKYQQKLEQIILDANPEEKEKRAYEDRLRDLKLFGTSKEALLLEMNTAQTEEERSLLKKRYDAFVLLEQQYQDNLLKIRKETKAKQKAKSEEDFENDFAERKAQLEQEIADKENKVTIDVGMGALTGTSAFDAEVELQRMRIQLIQEEVNARNKAGLDISKTLQKQRKEEHSLTQMYVSEYNRRVQQYQNYAQSLGDTLGNAIANQESILSAFGSTAIDILFDVLSQIITAEIAKVTAVGVSAIAQTSANQIASKGFLGIGTAAVLTGLITAAMATAKSALKGLLSGKSGSNSSSSTSSGERVYAQRASGKYDVIGAEDGKLYNNVPYAGLASTGVVSQPTLMGEQGEELVISHPDFIFLKKHINYPLIVEAIKDARSGRVPQRASGKYDVMDNNSVSNNEHSELSIIDTLAGLKKAIDAFNNKELDVNYFKFEKAKKEVDRVRNGAKKR